MNPCFVHGSSCNTFQDALCRFAVCYLSCFMRLMFLSRLVILVLLASVCVPCVLKLRWSYWNYYCVRLGSHTVLRYSHDSRYSYYMYVFSRIAG